MATRIDSLTDAQRGQLDAWADRWIEMGLRTGAADRELFESSVRSCYQFAAIPFPDVVVWVTSPMVLSLAAPAAALAIELVEAEQRGTLTAGTSSHAVDGAVAEAVRVAVGVAVDGAVDGAVGGAVDGAVDGAVREAVDGAVGEAVRGAVAGAVRGAVDGAVDVAVAGAVDVAVDGAVDVAVDVAVGEAVGAVIRRSWHKRMGGQLWAGGWYWGGAWTSFFREVCHLELPGDTWDRARAYEGTIQSACWWWPHRRFVMVCERPVAIHRELTNPDVERGWGSHRLHCDDGPAVVWPDGWGVWAWHGVRVPQHVIDRPDTITAADVLAEPNAEVRRVMVERMTPERFLADADARPVQQDDYGKLWRIDLPDDEPLVMVELENSTVEPDGSTKTYYIRVSPQCQTALEAVAWSFDLKPDDYVLEAQS